MLGLDLEVLVAGQVDLDGQVLIFLELARDLALQGGVQHARCVCRARKKGEYEQNYFHVVISFGVINNMS